MKKITLFALLTLALTLMLQSNAIAGNMEKIYPIEGNIPWDIEKLKQVPDYRVVAEENGIQSIIYSSAEFDGKTKEVFAYYCTPGILSGNKSQDKNLPTVVLIHGGGVSAFQNWGERWAKEWAVKGYAAISIDLRNKRQLPDGFDINLSMNGAIPDEQSYILVNEDQSRDWVFQAICDICLAHSIILSLPETDPTKSLVTGASWGGIFTCIVAGLDDRYTAAIPVYGCGYMKDSGTVKKHFATGTDLLRERWLTQYDPAPYMANTKIPVLLVNGTTDQHFYTESWMKSSVLIDKIYRSMRKDLGHSLAFARDHAEIYAFANNMLGVYVQSIMPEFEGLSYKNGNLKCSITNLGANDKVSIVSNNDDIQDETATWSRKYIDHKRGKVNTPIDDDNRAFFISVEMESGEHYSSGIIFK